jgi:hypothetical protein
VSLQAQLQLQLQHVCITSLALLPAGVRAVFVLQQMRISATDAQQTNPVYYIAIRVLLAIQPCAVFCAAIADQHLRRRPTTVDQRSHEVYLLLCPPAVFLQALSTMVAATSDGCGQWHCVPGCVAHP